MRYQAIWNWFSTVVTLIVIIFCCMDMFASVSPIDVEMIKRVCSDKDPNCRTSDAYWIAVQIGRLDIISICLAILGVSVGLSAVFGFLYVKEKSEMLASQAAEQTIAKLSSQIKEDVQKQAIEFMEENLPKIAQDYVDLVTSSMGAGEEANQIAGEMDNGDKT